MHHSSGHLWAIHFFLLHLLKKNYFQVAAILHGLSPQDQALHHSKSRKEKRKEIWDERMHYDGVHTYIYIYSIEVFSIT